MKYTQQAHTCVVPTCKYARMWLETEPDELYYIYLHSLAFYYAMQLCSIAAVEIFSNLTRAIRH